jgi:hypothetical protein
MYPSGAWRGYWDQHYFGRQLMHDLTLYFANGRIDGGGHDIIGSFTFSGEYDDAGGVMLMKHYLGKHSVNYVGRYDGEGTIYGRWFIGETWTGPFALSPSHFTAADAPILTIKAEPPVTVGD